MNMAEAYKMVCELAYRMGLEAADDCLADLAMVKPVECLLLRELMNRDPYMAPYRQGTEASYVVTLSEAYLKVPRPDGTWELWVSVPFQDSTKNHLDAVIEWYRQEFTFPKDVALVAFHVTRIPELPVVELGGEGELNELCRLLDYPWEDGLFQRLDVYPNQ